MTGDVIAGISVRFFKKYSKQLDFFQLLAQAGLAEVLHPWLGVEPFAC